MIAFDLDCQALPASQRFEDFITDASNLIKI
jgi:hypothetical protein